MNRIGAYQTKTQNVHRNLGRYGLFLICATMIISCARPTWKEHEIDKNFEFHGENQVTFKLSYIGCACGPDYPQYHIDSVLATDNDDPEYYSNKEISLTFRDPELEKKLVAPNCPTRCVRYVLSGNFEKNGYGMHRLAVSSGEIVTDAKCCERNR